MKRLTAGFRKGVLLSRQRDRLCLAIRRKVKTMKRKVNEVSRLTGVSKRTLQYYDDEGKQILELTEKEREKYLEQKLEKIRKEMQRLEEQKCFIAMMGKYGIPPVPVEENESGKSYVEWIMELRKAWNKSI